MNLCTRLFSRYISYSLSFVIKYPDKSSLREKGLIWVQLIVHHSKEAYGVRGLRLPSMLYPLSRSRGDECLCSASFLFMKSKTKAHGVMPLKLRVHLPGLERWLSH